MNPFPYPNPNFEPAQPYAFEPAQPYPVAGKRISTKAKLFIAGAVLAMVVTVITVIAIVAANMHGHGASAFLSELHDVGFYNASGDSAELSHGYEVCSSLKGGSSVASAAHSFWLQSPDLNYDSALKFVNVAKDYLC